MKTEHSPADAKSLSDKLIKTYENYIELALCADVCGWYGCRVDENLLRLAASSRFSLVDVPDYGQYVRCEYHTCRELVVRT